MSATISAAALDAVMETLSDVGFSPFIEYEGEIRTAPSLAAPYPAAVSVRKVTLGEYVAGSAPKCCAEVTVQVRAFGAKRGFFDAEKLSELTESAAGEMYFSSSAIVKGITCGSVGRSMTLGRLERELEITLLLPIEEGEQ